MVDRRMKTTVKRCGLRAGLLATALGVSIGLTGCIQSPNALPGYTPSASAAPSAAPTASPTPTATLQKFAEDCTTLLTAAQVYTFNPNYVVDPGYAPKPGSVAAAIAADLGQTCGWINETSGTEVEVAITALPADQWTAARAAAADGTPISTAGEHGFFAVKNGVGSAQLFFGTLWLDVSSVDFTTATDAEALYPVVVRNQLTAGG